MEKLEYSSSDSDEATIPLLESVESFTGRRRKNIELESSPMITQDKSEILQIHSSSGLNEKHGRKVGRLTLFSTVFWHGLKNFLLVGFDSPFSSLTLQAYFVAVLIGAAAYLEFLISISALSLGITPLLSCETGAYWKALCRIMVGMIASVFLRVLSGFMGAKLRLRWRSQIVATLKREIFSTPGFVYYLVNVQENTDNLDQRLTEDVERATLLSWSFVFGHLESKGIVSLSSTLLFSFSALSKLGTKTVVPLVLYGAVYVGLIAFAMRPVVKLTFQQYKFEGAFRHVQLRIREFCESILLLFGVEYEHKCSKHLFDKVLQNNRKLIDTEAVVTALRVFGSLFQTLLAFLLVANLSNESENISNPAKIIVNDNDSPSTRESEKFRLVSTAFMVLMSSISPVMNLLSLFSKLAPIAGTIHRVGDLLETIETAKVIYSKNQMKLARMVRKRGLGVKKDIIEVKNLMCCIPKTGGSALFENVNFTVHPGESLLITGPSGCGKTSLLRMLGGLWPVSSGYIIKPSNIGARGLFFLPQRPYMPMSTLRELLVYPGFPAGLGIEKDIILLNLLRLVRLDFMVNTYGFDHVDNWSDILSHGEQQRIGFVRMLYHSPLFCVMDEATSELDPSLEDICMQACSNLNVTCISVGHRPSLVKYHKNMLWFDGEGNHFMKELKHATQPNSKTLSPGYLKADEVNSTTVESGNSVRAATSMHEADQYTFEESANFRLAYNRLTSVFLIGLRKMRTIDYFWLLLGISLEITYYVFNVIVVTKILHPIVLQKLSNGQDADKELIRYGLLACLMGTIHTISLWLSKRIGLLWRKFLVEHLLSKYFNDVNLYNVNHLCTAVDNVDLRIAMDVKQYTENFVEHVFGYGGILGTVVMIALTVSSSILTFRVLAVSVSYSIGVMCGLSFAMKKVAQSKRDLNLCEGNFRRDISRISEFSESIAFYGGEETENERVRTSFRDVTSAYNKYISSEYLLYGLTEFAGATSLLASSAFYVIFVYSCSEASKPTISTLIAGTSTLQMMISSFVCLPKSISKFASSFGNLDRICALDELFKMLACDRQSFAKQSSFASIIYDNTTIAVSHLTCSVPRSNNVLFKDLSFKVDRGESLMIMGPSGIGKTSIVRILGGLWHCSSGEIRRPKTIGRKGIFFLPQRPYFFFGTLRSQLTYPALFLGDSDDKLLELLKLVHLEHLIEVKGGLDRLASWPNILSYGEQQRVGFIRLFFHRPLFCVMDEATSALDKKIESICMAYCKSLDISCISVGHRPSLMKFHTQILSLREGGEGYIASAPAMDISRASTIPG